MREQDAGWVTHRSDGDPSEVLEHPGVVVRVISDGRGIVAQGTGTERDERHVRVDPASPDGRALRLSKPTFFYTKPLVVRPESFRATVVCPPDLFIALRRLVGF
ncbi:MAG: hypothetical protein J0L92_00965 [Deltaproteobacteria bacterium]|nr:hypothetical protein [Deltaproteobacteria bacterium]